MESWTTLITDVYISSIEPDPDGDGVSPEDIAPKGPFLMMIYPTFWRTQTLSNR